MNLALFYVSKRFNKIIKQSILLGKWQINNHSKRAIWCQTPAQLSKNLPSDWGSKKHAGKRKINLQLVDNMLSPEAEEQLAPLRARVKQQGDVVRKLKEEKAADLDVKKEVQELKSRKKDLEDMTLKLMPGVSFDRARMSDLIKRRFFYDNSFAIYGGITGQYDYGPMGCDLIDNILSVWHKHFVLKERMSKVNCSILTPETVLKASGHVDKFADYMVKDAKTGECFRLDHLIKQHFEKILIDKKASQDTKKIINKNLAMLEGMTMKEMNDLVKEYKMNSPLTGNELSDAMEFNLMFPITIGPSGAVKGFLRPETAQGIFVNFKRLLEYNMGKLPFACAQVGNAYRNEISPRAGLLRVREFTMAEIEHFCDPDDKTHTKFHQVADTELNLYSACAQMDGLSAKKMTIGEAVNGSGLASICHLKTLTDMASLDKLLQQNSYIDGYSPTQLDVSVYKAIPQGCSTIPDHLYHVHRWYNQINSFTAEQRQHFPGEPKLLQDINSPRLKGLVANETLGYYMARIHLFLIKIGVDPQRLRFRQHMGNEMAHYACDCWDAESLTSYGWTECVGCADRSAFDLTQHTNASGIKLTVDRQLDEPRIVERVEVVSSKAIIGKTFKGSTKAVMDEIAALKDEEALEMDKVLTDSGEYELKSGNKITREMVIKIKKEKKTIHKEEIVPSVIEPSFGIGRVFYTLLEHTFRVREQDDKRTYFSIPAVVAPIKVAVLPLSGNKEFVPFTHQLADALTELDLSVRIDESTGSIGRRYSRTDEIAVPFGVTVDFDTVNNNPHTVTIRERDSTEQIRIPIDEVPITIRKLADGKLKWKDVTEKYPKFEAQETS